MSARIFIWIALVALVSGQFRRLEESIDEAAMDTKQLYQFRGYPVWNTFVETADGMYINLYRIPGPKNESLTDAIKNSYLQPREPLLLLHGISASSDCFSLNGPELSMGYLLADTGRYDLWLFNARGTKYSRKHMHLESNSETEFWDFSFEEIGEYDLLASIDYVLNATGKEKLTLAGYSQGTTISFFAMAEFPSFFRSKVKLFLGFAACMTLQYSTDELLRELSGNVAAQDYLYSRDYVEVFSSKSETLIINTWMASKVCGVWPEMCSGGLNFLTGMETDLLNMDQMSVYVGHMASGTSLKNMIHMGQLMASNGTFQKFDYGPEQNLIRYGSEAPAKIPIEDISIPVGLFMGTFDTLATIADMNGHLTEIGANSEGGKKVVFYQEYALDHLSFVLGKSIHHITDAIKLMDQYNGFA